MIVRGAVLPTVTGVTRVIGAARRLVWERRLIRVSKTALASGRVLRRLRSVVGLPTVVGMLIIEVGRLSVGELGVGERGMVAVAVAGGVGGLLLLPGAAAGIIIARAFPLCLLGQPQRAPGRDVDAVGEVGQG